ncbi:hypothetical protein SIM91_33380 [Rhodococcus opacus]|uniref:hypothetical protein n=1 Tax=Rhodococcus opacus TaxID=37919 RepID=UPI0002A348A9|nr:hypothetical protein [Rhodococcus opacus]ELB86777.1 hypothetical protein Rwratislav_43094 [Rhodococcus wratislaviensis IFP 2016]MDX5968101.1 hypothetical protein [Rhodococcus opacus]NKY73331.1 hypothetical protein [Rhodococcus opacus]
MATAFGQAKHSRNDAVHGRPGSLCGLWVKSAQAAGAVSRSPRAMAAASSGSSDNSTKVSASPPRTSRIAPTRWACSAASVSPRAIVSLAASRPDGSRSM